MAWLKTVVFVVEGDTTEEAQEVWQDEGPECGPGVTVYAEGEFKPEPPA
jgi:hypothetical protein